MYLYFFPYICRNKNQTHLNSNYSKKMKTQNSQSHQITKKQNVRHTANARMCC